jgi:DNA-binding transcriptional regulator YhcF (GntR family)
MKKRSRARLVMDIAFLLISKYPVAWKASELALATGEQVRTIHRALSDMTQAGVVEKHYTAYRLATPLATQMYEAKWYLKQETNKNLTIQKLQEECKTQ